MTRRTREVNKNVEIAYGSNKKIKIIIKIKNKFDPVASVEKLWRSM